MIHCIPFNYLLRMAIQRKQSGKDYYNTPGFKSDHFSISL